MAEQQDKEQPKIVLVPRKQHCPHCGRYLGDSTALDGWTTQKCPGCGRWLRIMFSPRGSVIK